MRIARFTTGEDPRFGVVVGEPVGVEELAVAGDRLYTPIQSLNAEQLLIACDPLRWVTSHECDTDVKGGHVRRRLEVCSSAAVDESVLDCEADVFGHYYGNSAAELHATYGPYQDQTLFLAVWADGAVVGVCRVIRAGQVRLKTIEDLEAAPWGVDAARCVDAVGLDLARTWDVATIAVRPGVGVASRMASAALFHGLIQISIVNQVDWMTAVLDARARAVMAIQGLQVHAFPGTTAGPYLGSPASTPVYAHMGRLLERQRRTNPEAYRVLMFGSGLDDMVLPSRAEYRVSDADVEARFEDWSARREAIDLRDDRMGRV